VFTHSRAEWDYSRTNNDVYLDDASLTVVGEGTTLPGTVQPTSSPAPTLTPANTPTPRPDGAIVHIVGPSDTLYGISLQYGVPYDDLLQLNNLSRTSILTIGQVLVVKAGRGTAIAQQATPTTSTSTRAQDTPTVAPTGAPTLTRTPAPTETAQPVPPAPGRSNTTLPVVAVVAIVAIVVVVAIRRRR
jgi:LysM repeat protein